MYSIHSTTESNIGFRETSEIGENIWVHTLDLLKSTLISNKEGVIFKQTYLDNLAEAGLTARIEGTFKATGDLRNPGLEQVPGLIYPQSVLETTIIIPINGVISDYYASQDYKKNIILLNHKNQFGGFANGLWLRIIFQNYDVEELVTQEDSIEARLTNCSWQARILAGKNFSSINEKFTNKYKQELIVTRGDLDDSLVIGAPNEYLFNPRKEKFYLGIVLENIAQAQEQQTQH